MGNTTFTYKLYYPTSQDEMNIPKDMQALADSTEAALGTLESRNMIVSASARISNPDTEPWDYCAATVTNGVLSLVYPRLITDDEKLNVDGGVISGNLTVQGHITVIDPTESYHAASKAYVDVSSTPVGAIMLWPSSDPLTIPTYWALCNGATHTSEKLNVILKNAYKTPNMPPATIGVGIYSYIVYLGA